MSWQDLSDEELVARLEQRGVPEEAAKAIIWGARNEEPADLPPLITDWLAEMLGDE